MRSIDLADVAPSASARANARDDAPPLAPTLRLVMAHHRRLQRLLGMHAPEIIVRNEGRMLRAALGALAATGCATAGRRVGAGSLPGAQAAPRRDIR